MDGVNYVPQATLYAMVAFQQMTEAQVLATSGAKDGYVLAVTKENEIKVLVLNADLQNDEPFKLLPKRPLNNANIRYLRTPSYASDAEAMTLGQAHILGDGTFQPAWTPVSKAPDGSIAFSLCGGCAALIALH
jgi:hypothetical protein